MGIAEEKYVSITTYRKNGEAVSTPVWIAQLADGRSGFTTDSASGKAKRLRNNAAVTLQACTMRGAVIAGAPIVPATATVVSGSEFEAVRAAIKRKYGIAVTLITLGERISRLIRRAKHHELVAVIIVVDGDDHVTPTPV